MKIDTRSNIYATAAKMLAGLKRHGVVLNIVHVTVAALTAALKAARAAESLYQNSRGAKRTAVVTQNTTREGIEAWCIRARDVLRPFLGNSWNESWAEAGFKQNTLSLPASLAELLELARSLREYFVNHSNRQNATVDVTSAMADQHFNNLDSAVAAVGDGKSDQRGKREARDAAEAALLNLLRKLHCELGAALEPDDVRWLDFEGKAPTDESVPEAPNELQVEADVRSLSMRNGCRRSAWNVIRWRCRRRTRTRNSAA